mmetsp:Transcript_34793/g.81222  ORF Transcript_34793/g.81222 Transcript_34793/m.81222 type:complete len:222 (-) Transcript_34793:1424-2089(-)
MQTWLARSQRGSLTIVSGHLSLPRLADETLAVLINAATAILDSDPIQCISTQCLASEAQANKAATSRSTHLVRSALGCTALNTQEAWVGCCSIQLAGVEKDRPSSTSAREHLCSGPALHRCARCALSSHLHRWPELKSRCRQPDKSSAMGRPEERGVILLAWRQRTSTSRGTLCWNGHVVLLVVRVVRITRLRASVVADRIILGTTATSADVRAPAATASN